MEDDTERFEGGGSSFTIFTTRPTDEKVRRVIGYLSGLSVTALNDAIARGYFPDAVPLSEEQPKKILMCPLLFRFLGYCLLDFRI